MKDEKFRMYMAWTKKVETQSVKSTSQSLRDRKLISLQLWSFRSYTRVTLPASTVRTSHTQFLEPPTATSLVLNKTKDFKVVTI
jgi:hypothetical protein